MLSSSPAAAPTPAPTPAPTSCRCVAYYGVNRGVGNFAFRDDGLVYGSLPAVNPASEHYDLSWAAGPTCTGTPTAGGTCVRTFLPMPTRRSRPRTAPPAASSSVR